MSLTPDELVQDLITTQLKTIRLTNETMVRPKDIAKGRFIRILGFAKNDDTLYVLTEWTTGQGYVPYSLMKKKYPEQLIEYYKSCSKFVSMK